jgi:MATE family multidrug resistance protein
VRLAWPIAVSVLSYSVMNIVDTYFVARLGSAAVGGVGLGGLASFTVLCFAFGLLRAVKVLVSQEVGAGRRDVARATLGAGLWVALGLGVLGTLLTLPVAWFVLPRVAASSAVADHARDYTLIRALGALPVLLGSTLREGRYGFSDSRSPMWAAVGVNLLHIPLNYALIFGLHLGVAGAAWSTLSVQLLDCAILGWVQLHDGLGLRAARRAHAVSILKVGAATGLEFFLGVSAFSVLVAFVAHMSEADLAAHQIAIQIIHFAFLPVVAVGEAASVLSGQVVGAGRDELVPRVARLAVAIGAGYATLCTLIFGLFARQLPTWFGAEPAVVDIATHLLWVAAAFQLIDAVGIVLRALLRGTGDVRIPALQAVISSWLLVPALTFWLGFSHGLGALGGWLALTADMTFGAAFVAGRLAFGAWRSEAVRSRERMQTPARAVS